ncbi:hypothetical protein ES288_A11G357500v1 [Gossypium darwinii]|uniref:Uncharacterized protein n=1 Tax=Gossypium darwinii TaxID=34276 RepID=A0A5D2EUM0_GOSDA|nr:hypothetical protein ES288_A11G357500v1 [Gossypium darwinii]
MCFLAMGWKGKRFLSIEVGSIEVFNWVENNGVKPWLLHTFFNEMESKGCGVGYVLFSKADKQANMMAFALAFTGMEKSDLFKAWW